MAIGSTRDPEVTARALADWLEGVLDGASDVVVSDVRTPGATGYSNETLLFHAAWRGDDGGHGRDLVARVEPTTAGVFPTYDVGLQHDMLRALAARSSVPVPPALWQEQDAAVLGAPFYVMARVEGVVPSDNPPYTLEGWVLEAAPEAQRTLYTSALDTMAALHRLDWEDGFAFLSGRVPVGLDAHLDDTDRYFEWATQGRPQPVADAARAWVHEHRPVEPQPLAVCWGDARISNMIFREFRPVAVLDWEMVTVGDPVSDLAWWLFLDRHFTEGLSVENPPGFPSRAETVARWEAAVGRRADHLEFYEVFAGLRFAIVMMRIAQLLMEADMLPPDSDFERNNIVTQVLARMLELPAPAAG